MALVLTRPVAPNVEAATPKNAITVHHRGEELTFLIVHKPDSGRKVSLIFIPGDRTFVVLRTELCDDVTLEAEA